MYHIQRVKLRTYITQLYFLHSLIYSSLILHYLIGLSGLDRDTPLQLLQLFMIFLFFVFVIHETRMLFILDQTHTELCRQVE